MSALQRLGWRVATLAFVMLLAALALPSLVAARLFERELTPEYAATALTLGRSLQTLFERATTHDIALAQLVGVDALFSQVQQQHPEFELLALSDARGQVLFRRGGSVQAVQGLRPAQPALHDSGVYSVLTLPLNDAGGGRAWLHIGSHRNDLQALLRETWLDIAVVFVVALFITLELLRMLAGGAAARPWIELGRTLRRGHHGDFSQRCDTATVRELGALPASLNRLFDDVQAHYTATRARLGGALRGCGAAGRRQLRGALRLLRALRRRWHFEVRARQAPALAEPLMRLRAPLFLFLVAEDLSRSFMPLFTSTVYSPRPGLSQQLAVGLPIVLFMFIVAVLQPVLGRASERWGRRRTLLAGIALGVLAHGGAALAQTLVELLLWRGLAGAAWALVFVAGQGVVLDHSDARSRSQALATFVGVIMVSSVCGPSIGGILADGLGARATLGLAALLAALAGVLAWRGLAPDVPHARQAARLRWSDARQLARRRRFVVLCVAGAMPAKIVLIGFCFYLVPLVVLQLGGTLAMAGRLIMLYGVIMVLVTPLAAKWADRRHRHAAAVLAGLMLSALAGVLPLALPGLAGVAAAVLLLGVAQAISIAPQSALVARVCQPEIALLGEGTVYGVYRLVERTGNALGPLLAAAVVQRWGYSEAFAAIGALAAVAALCFGATFGWAAERTAHA